MNKYKIILDYLLGFITCLLCSLLVIVFILKNNIFTEKNLLEKFEKENYYEEVYNITLEDMKDYMVSSGFEEEILDNIFSVNDIKKDVNGYINSYFKNSEYKINSKLVSNNIRSNIDKYLVKNNIDVQNKEELEMFLTDMENIYVKRVNFYNMLGNFKNRFYKIYNLIYKAQIILGGVILLLNILMIHMKNKHIASVYMASGFILLFVRFLIYEKIDFRTLVIISDAFSKVLKVLLTNIASELIIFGIILVVIGILISQLEPTKVDGSKITINRDNEEIKKRLNIDSKKKNRKKVERARKT